MSVVFAAAGVAIALVLAAPSAMFMVECLAGRRGRGPELLPLRAPRVVVLVPAHDEECGLEEILAELLFALDRGMTVLVVADNCTDRTAEIASRLGAMVVARDEPDRVGKGYAIERGVESLSADPPEVVVVIDADCRIEADSLRRIADLAHHTGRPVQAEDLMEPRDRTLIARTSAFAFTVKNRVRTRGLHRLGVPVPLAGTGMAFPFALLRSAPRMRGHLAEDRLLGIELTLGGRPPFYAADASVRSLLPSTRAAARRQRSRWESGSLALLRSHGARVFREALRHRRPQLFGLALDLAIPPLSLLVLFAALALAFVSVAVSTGAPGALLLVGAAPMAFVAVGVLSAWGAEGRELLGAGQLALVPFYVLWKIPLYLGMAVRSVPLRWERTARERIE